MIGETREAPASSEVGGQRAAEERVSTLTGDRLCLQCGYNLVGQSVLREPHYELLIVRCPECGTVAGVQEYPLLGRWAGRLGIVLVALWFIVLLGAWGGSTGAICGFSIATAEGASQDYGRYLRDLYRATKDPTFVTVPGSTGLPPGRPVPPRQTTAGGRPADYLAWWQAQDQDALLAGAGGWLGAVNWGALLACIPGALLFFGIGWFWTVALLSVRRRWVVAWGIVILLIASVVAVSAVWEWVDAPMRRYIHAGRGEIGVPMLLVLLAYIGVAITTGVLLGRPLTRLLVRALLPPRLRGPLAGLWLIEGLTPPGGAASR